MNNLKIHICLILAAFLLVFLVFTCGHVYSNSPPRQLDDALVGPASEENPIFHYILKNPVTDKEWVKVGQNTYIDPCGQLFIYNPSTGEIENAGETTKAGEYTYDADGNILRRLVNIKNADGKTQGYLEFSGYVYNFDGKLIEYTRMSKDAGGSVIERCAYMNFIYDTNGQLISYSRNDTDADGRRLAFYEFNLDKSGRYKSYTKISYNKSGNIQKISNYENIIYDSSGKRAGYRRIERDARWNILKIYEYTDYQYVDEKITGFQETEKTPGGEILSRKTISTDPS
ncbi:MAG: hypothetical protein JW928_04865 [Candidatus Aureabacteria bacterium]|nr:hypothetical protein [Candidatus Auribacterota bacterium]